MFKRAFYSLIALGLAAPALAKVEAVDGYVRLLPPGSPNTAAFLVLKNDADKPVKLVAATSSEVGRAELHTHLHENGVMKMRQVESIEVPAKGEVALKPGSFHIMLFEVRELFQGTPFPLTLTMDDGQKLELSLPVKPIEPMAGMQH
ncbi:MAG: copper chaperone PCu(A)C [Aeromonas popoffii]|jgi:copper(I)-binding protein|uniref:Copper chaperone PCu(A)C n=1 Tax=Aeromonas popoffii TaxID=70856 RepID=A0ABS5GLZ0_9GAMM|nr:MULTISPECIES: copper chaperone PCu(A)C [Aeromonas]MBR7628150.1 copper chaperone PCu(A)C [Aeromonas popoffii]MDF2414576.1 copper chaperone PCu(A)C [Aeromonas sp. 1HA1]PTT46844.1 copper chaperone PCu(A)C [Aeromonas sp. HMWF014]